LLCRAWILRLARKLVGAGVAGDEAISFNINLLVGLFLWASSLARPAPTGCCVWPGSCGWPGTLWERPGGDPIAGDEAISFNINLLVGLFLPASSLHGYLHNFRSPQNDAPPRTCVSGC